MPEEVKTDVPVAPSTTTEVVKEDTATQPKADGSQVVPEQGNAQVIEDSKLQPLDTRGVPLQNVEMEYQRKYQQLIEKQPELIKEAVQAAIVASREQEKPRYTEEQLNLVIHDDTGQYTSQNKAWAEQEKSRLQEEKIARLFDEKFQLSNRQQEEQKIKISSEKYVTSAFPEMFLKDTAGNITGWDLNNPITKLTAQYMEHPSVKGRPDAIVLASKQAYADYMLSQKQMSASKQELAKSVEATAKKATIIEGISGKNSKEQDFKLQALKDKFEKSGSPRDAAAYYQELGRSQVKG